MHKLKITNCKSHIQEITLPEGVHTIGRSLDSTIRLEGEEVSRLHARVTINGSTCKISDNQSKNGTFINNSRITSSLLVDGDTIKIGKFDLLCLSDTVRSHPYQSAKNAASTPNKKYPVTATVALILLLTTIITVFGLLYSIHSHRKTTLQLAERTAQYLAEKNKEALYLGEYTSIDLSHLPPAVTAISIWDRNGVLRAQKPPVTELSVKLSDSTQLVRSGNTVTVFTPIRHQFTRVGTLWIKYKL